MDLHYSDATLIKKLVANEQLKLSGPNKKFLCMVIYLYDKLNVIYDHTLQIADFGMARDVCDDTYYITRGGKIPIKWTAPEV